MPRTARAKTKAGRYMTKLVPRRRPREKILASGDVIRTYEDLMREIAERRGGAGQ